MARKPKSPFDSKVKPSDALINAALVLASLEGWQNVTMAKVAAEASLNLAVALS